MKFYHPRAVCLLAPLVLAGCWYSTARADETPGLAIGEKAPEFTLNDQHGQPVSLTKLLEKNNVAVVFHRSADW